MLSKSRAYSLFDTGPQTMFHAKRIKAAVAFWLRLRCHIPAIVVINPVQVVAFLNVKEPGYHVRYNRIIVMQVAASPTSKRQKRFTIYLKL